LALLVCRMRDREIDRGQTFLEGKDWTGGALRRATSGVGERFRACRGLWNVGRGGGTVKHPNRETAVESHPSKNEEWGTRGQNSLPITPVVRAIACRGVCRPPRQSAARTRLARGDTSGDRMSAPGSTSPRCHNICGKAYDRKHQGVRHGPISREARRDVAAGDPVDSAMGGLKQQECFAHRLAPCREDAGRMEHHVAAQREDDAREQGADASKNAAWMCVSWTPSLISLFLEASSATSSARRS